MIYLPSGVTLTAFTINMCIQNLLCSLPVANSHTLIEFVLLDPETIYLPSGVMVTEFTLSLVHLGHKLLNSLPVANSHTLIVPS